MSAVVRPGAAVAGPPPRRRLMPWLRRWGDLVLAVVLAVGNVIEPSRYHPADHVVAVPLGVLAGLVMVLRRRSPLVTLLVVYACATAMVLVARNFMGNSVCMVAVVMLALYSVGANAKGVEAWLGGIGVVLGVVGLDFQDGDTSPAGIFFFILFAGLPWGTGLVIRLRMQRVRELAAANAALAEEARRAVADERMRIARELHDVVSHAIAVTILQARGARKVVGHDDVAARRALDAIEQTNGSALADMRRLLALLRTADGGDNRDEPAPGLDRLEELAEQVRSSGVPVEILVSGDPLPLPPGLDLSAYRIVQEALTNVIKHGGPDAEAVVAVGYGPAALELVVTNTGRSDGVPTAGGHGLIGIRERVTVAGGTFEAGPTQNGYSVTATLPYLTGTPAVVEPDRPEARPRSMS